MTRQVQIQLEVKSLLAKKLSKTISDSQINRLANSLPSVEVLTQERHFVYGRELMAQGHTEEKGETIIPDRMYEQYMPVIIEHNHKRAMKKLYRRYGDTGVIEYFNQVMQKSNETTTSES